MALTVAIVGATGETGSSITNALLSATPKIDITALIRPSSLQKPAVIDLGKKGVRIVSLDLQNDDVKKITEMLKGVDVVISAIISSNLGVQDEIPLIDAAKSAGVKRYLPCFYAIPAAPKGVLDLRDKKEEVLNHIKKIKLPYTVLDVGWWYQLALPRLPSGRLDYMSPATVPGIGGDGNVPIGLTDLRDIGRYVLRVISDPRTLNRMIFAYNELVSRNEIYDLLEKFSGETVPRKYFTEEEIAATIQEARDANLSGRSEYVIAVNQYMHMCDIRGDSTPENARYLGYLISKDLYPGFLYTKFEDYVKEALDGKLKGVYQDKRA